jgi:hypothetical protein
MTTPPLLGIPQGVAMLRPLIQHVKKKGTNLSSDGFVSPSPDDRKGYEILSHVANHFY